LRGYRQALATSEIAFDTALVRPGNWEPSSGYSNTLELMKLKHPPTAIFCSNDLMALGSFEALKELGMRIPQDVSIFGYDDREVAQFAHPPLSTVLLPHRAMGELALDTLLERIGNPKATPPQIKVECPLILRDSVLLASEIAPMEKTAGGMR
jgi:LacI family transcriptional regulator